MVVVRCIVGQEPSMRKVLHLAMARIGCWILHNSQVGLDREV